MQNRYVADIGDYGKYGLLKYICDSKLKLGIHWCLHPDENHNDDGKYISYLDKPEEYEIYDNELYSQLQKIIKDWKSSKCDSKNRAVNLIENKILNKYNISFYSKELNNKLLRDKYLNDSKEALKKAEIIFFDPDTGFEVKSVTKMDKKAYKYVFFEELKKFNENGQSLIVYQHKDHSSDCYEKKMDELSKYFSSENIFYLSFLGTGKRAYFFITHNNHYSEIKKSIDLFIKSPWKQLFELKEKKES
jgi:hypothetical protein